MRLVGGPDDGREFRIDFPDDSPRNEVVTWNEMSPKMVYKRIDTDGDVDIFEYQQN